ncbi:gustatory receptor for sugar taste 64a-like [Culicoides brevitarsis]|uniref:gustatory receptor for sugar taste 64a-like n=1 Tax=Culicoides brevitarsis TaxID=469753 RepID=UPI00307BAD16
MLKLMRIFTIVGRFKRKNLRNRTPSINIEAIDWNFTKKSDEKSKIRKKCVSFHKAIRWFLLLLCFLSIYPVSGIMNNDPRRLSYRKFSFRFFFSMILLSFATFETICITRTFFMSHGGVLRATGVVFYFCATLSLYLFHAVARKWHDYILYWKKHEKVFLSEPYPMPKYNLEKLLTRIGCVSLGIGFVEHTCFITGEFLKSYRTIVYCNATARVNLVALSYFKHKNHVIQVTGFSNWLIPLLEWTNFSITLAWNSGDILISVVSIALITRFQQFNKRLRNAFDEKIDLTEDDWRELRTHYGLLVDLTRKTDKLLANFIFLSCSNNLYFICTFLFHIGDERSDIIFHVQHWITTIYLILRTFMVLYLGASVYETSRRILPTIKSVPANKYNIEIKRFLDQIAAEPAILSGHGFFFLTKPLILGMAGVIATYEIVLMNQLKRLPPEAPNCSFSDL